MRRRALLVGSQTGNLRGVNADVALMHDVLREWRFDTTRVSGADATYQGIVDAYRSFVAATELDDAVVVYYSGHGARYRNPTARQDPDQARWLQYLLPVDINAHGDGEFRGLLAEELSLLQLALTQRTANVTTILDCCHSARMSRDPGLLPKSPMRPPPFPWPAVQAKWVAIRSAQDGPVRGEANPDAVQLVACGPDESAYELDIADFGEPHGVLTATLARVLREPGSERLTWHGLLGLLRPAITDLVVNQRPEAAGRTDRYLFDTATRSTVGVLPVAVAGETAVLEGAQLFGIAEGDTYAVVPPDGDPTAPLATATVDRVNGGTARLVLDVLTPQELPAGVQAHPLEVALGRRPVAIAPLEHPDRSRVVEALRRSPNVRVADAGGPAMATVQLGHGDLQVLDAVSEPLLSAPRPLTNGGIRLLGRDLERLARAAHVRELDSGIGDAELADDISLEYALLAGGTEQPLARSGTHLFAGDQVVVRIRNRSGERRFVTVFDIGLTGSVTPLTTAQATGALIEHGGDYELYRLPATNQLVGIELFWPDGLPLGAPRPETFLSIVTDRPEDLTPLAQTGVRTRGARRSGSSLRRLVENLASGIRDGRPPEEPLEVTRYAVERFDFILHPERRPVAEPVFAVDERPDPSFRLVVPKAAGPVPDRAAVRLREIQPHTDGPLRVDVLAVTHDQFTPHRASTHRLQPGADGRSFVIDLPLFDGLVADFLDLAVWTSRNIDGDDLEDQLRSMPNAGLHDADGGARSVDAVAALISLVTSLLDGTPAYRTSFLPHERFGGGDPGRRHPSVGLLATPALSFSYEVTTAG